MPDLVVRHLRLRIVRSGTLFWGGDPRVLARRTLAELPRILAEELDRLGIGDQDDLVVTTAVRLRVRGTFAELTAGFDQPEAAHQLRAAVREAAIRILPQLPADRVRPDQAERHGTSRAPEPPLQRLLPWYLSGSLPARLESLEAGVVQAYHRLLLVDRDPGRRVPRDPTDEELRQAEQLVESLAAGLVHDGSARTSDQRLRQRVLAAVAVAGQVGIVPSDPRVRALIDKLLPWEAVVTPRAHAGGFSPGGAEPGGARASEPERPAASLEDQPAPILPLLAAALFARSGVLRRVADYLGNLERAEDLPLWIAGLAFKLGPTPVRGWMYTPDARLAVAAIADRPLASGEAIVHLADSVGAGWSTLSRTLFEGAPDPEIDPSLAIRPACSLARTQDFDRHMSWVATRALEGIASALWPHDRSPVRTTMERLESLEVRLIREEHGLSVRVPFGDRCQMLLRAGLLVEVPRAAWLRNGGWLRFHGG